MPTLAAPQTATYTTTSPNESVNVICTGATDCMLVSWVGPAGTSGQRMVRNTTAAGEDIGPLLDNTSVTFAAMAGAPSYTAPAFALPVQALVSGAGVRYQGTRTAPISTFNGASSSGLVGLPASLKIPANSIVYGQSRTELEVVLRKVGTSTGFVAFHFGPNNSIADTSVAPTAGNGFAATDPQEFEYRLILSYSAGKVYARITRFLATGGFVTDATETTVAFDPTVDNYLNCVMSGFVAGTTVALVAARFQHFQ